MASSKKKMDWTETLLWFGLGILGAVFVYQFLKLLSSGTTSLSNLPDAIGQALDNSIAAVENQLSGLITSPLAGIESLLSAIPTFLTDIFSWIPGIGSEIYAALGAGNLGLTIGSGLGSSLGGTTSASALPITNGAGSTSSYSNPTVFAAPGVSSPIETVGPSNPNSTFNANIGLQPLGGGLIGAFPDSWNN